MDDLLAKGLTCVTVLDISEAAIRRAQNRLGRDEQIVTWIEADVTADWSLRPMDIWHDRAVFHFLTNPDDRSRYKAHLRRTLKVGGTAIIATFALEGPDQCSGLPVSRYSPKTLAVELGPEFRLVQAVSHEHRTPGGSIQPFVYARFVRVVPDAPIVSAKDAAVPSIFSPATVLKEAQRQKGLSALHVPAIGVLDPDGDIVRWFKRTGRGSLSPTWACITPSYTS